MLWSTDEEREQSYYPVWEKQRMVGRERSVQRSCGSALGWGIEAVQEQQFGYHQRLSAETAIYRFKSLISSKLSLRNYKARGGEILASVNVMY